MTYLILQYFAVLFINIIFIIIFLQKFLEIVPPLTNFKVAQTATIFSPLFLQSSLMVKYAKNLTVLYINLRECMMWGS